MYLALDQGTTNSRSILFDVQERAIGAAGEEVAPSYPEPGWVEHDPERLWQAQLATARRALSEAEIRARDLTAIGITNQRETVVLWERSTGRPLANAVVWQDRRTSRRCEELRAAGQEPLVQGRSGLLLDPYFSATKMAWLLDHVPGAREAAERGQACLGTIDAYLIFRLTGGRVFATDVSNASRTMLFDIHRLCWDDQLLKLFGVPRAALPEVRPSAGDFGETDAELLGAAVPVRGVAGDQQAATFGQGCVNPGMVKNTYGTGSFLLLNTGHKPVESGTRLLTTVAWQLDGGVTYALEGSVFVAGSAVQWLRDQLGIISRSSEVEELARTVPDSGGVVFVPAFAGLGAPHWDPTARGAVLGLTRGTTKGHLARATLEAVCLQTRDVVDAMAADCGAPLSELRADGGMASDDFFLQMQADLLGIPVLRPQTTETTALGAARLAAIGAGAPTEPGPATHQRFEPKLNADQREQAYADWKRAVERARNWAQG